VKALVQIGDLNGELPTACGQDLIKSQSFPRLAIEPPAIQLIPGAPGVRIAAGSFNCNRPPLADEADRRYCNYACFGWLSSGQEVVELALDETYIRRSGPKRFICGNGGQKFEIGARACDAQFAERCAEARDCLIPVLTPNNQFGNHRIVIDRDCIA